jgi:hypothetical protein
MIDISNIFGGYSNNSNSGGTQTSTQVNVIYPKKLGVYLINGAFVLINPTEIKALIPINKTQCTIVVKDDNHDVDQDLNSLVIFLADNNFIFS